MGGLVWLGAPSFFLRGSSDSRLVSLVRDFFGKILTGGIVDYCTVLLLLFVSYCIFWFLIMVSALFLDVDLKVSCLYKHSKGYQTKVSAMPIYW